MVSFAEGQFMDFVTQIYPCCLITVEKISTVANKCKRAGENY